MKYKGQSAKEISFPLGGIGTGCIGLGGDGRLIDWEIYNKANKGSFNSYSHFAIRAINDGKITAAVLNGDIQKDYMGQYSKGYYCGYGFGPNFQKMYGFPHFKDVEFDGEKRNPWNEFECGSNYARAMASYSFVPILSGFEFDMPHNHIGFNPYVSGDFKCIWSLEDGWGNFEVCGNTVKINIFEGEIVLESVGVKFCNNVTAVKIDGKAVDFEHKDGKIYFEKTNILDCVEITA